jgi:integrase
MALAAGTPTPLWVTSSDGGTTPWRPDRVSRLFRRVADRDDARGVRLHDLRHYVATTMFEEGASSHDVAGQLGNTIATTEAKYRHWLPGRGREMIERRSARLDG